MLLEKLEACINYNAEGEGPNLPIYISVVLDGHGLLGEVSAQLAGRAAVRFLLRELSKLPGLADASVRELQDLFRRAFIQAHLASLKVYDSPPEVYSFPKVLQKPSRPL